MRLLPLLAISLVATACSKPAMDAAPASSPLSAAELDAVKAVDAAWAAGMNAHDTAAVFAVYAPDALLLPPDSPALQGEAAHPLLAGLIGAGASDFALTATTAYGTGDLAYLVGTATFKVGGNAESVKYTEVLRKNADGKWQYVVDMFSGIAPPSAAAPGKK